MNNFGNPEEKAVILIVDDVETNRLILESFLESDYKIEQAADGKKALEMLLSGNCKPSLMLLDIMMPEMDGFEVLKEMKANEITKKIPVIFITVADPTENEARGLKIGAIDYIVKPFSNDIVKLRVDNQMELSRHREKLEIMVKEKVDELMFAKENMLSSMASFIEYRNIETGDHVKRTGILTKIITEALLDEPNFKDELYEKDYTLMIKAAPLHDIGKIGVPDHILLKPGPERLTPEEFSIMETHTTTGSNMIKEMMKDAAEKDLYLQHCYNICRHHHERWDGKGYPDKLSGEAIPLSARIVSIVDVYDALVSPRVYKPPFSHTDAIKIIVDDSNIRFDRRIVEAFIKKEEMFKKIYNM